MMYKCRNCDYWHKDIFQLANHKILRHIIFERNTELTNPLLTTKGARALAWRFQDLIEQNAPRLDRAGQDPTNEEYEDWHANAMNLRWCPFCLNIYLGNKCFSHHIQERCFQVRHSFIMITNQMIFNFSHVC